MDSLPRGYCLIINNMSFEDKKLNRHCAIHDEQNLRALFENDLHFQVHIVNDLQNFQMEDICTEYSKKDHSKFDAFVCIVMSHGDTGDKIIGVKGRTIGIEQLMSKFKAKNCPSLAHKPKMFFIQACRGLAQDKFLTQSKGDNDYDAGLTSDSTLARCSSILPQESDFLLGYATVPGYVAYKQSNYGSFYMQALTDIIKRHHRRYHLEEMLVEVNNSVSEKCNQVSAKHSTLRGKVFL
ncbi:PREDICTED: caspase-3-like [Acropora digitifera]|uniref:caspase-3-like n=1 Tax=Acropora digitifera TaxID=70779 RepID=UPI00077ADEE9|nr:PREDICTED: caspase-3-like [Acropora digitifera]